MEDNKNLINSSNETSNLIDGKYAITDLIDLDNLKDLFDKFSKATGFPIGFLDPQSFNVLIETGWREICHGFHRGCPASLKLCRESDASLTRNLCKQGQLAVELCENGLVDCATPIIIKGKHIATLCTGQLLIDDPEIERFRNQAKRFGFEEKAYLEALAQVPVVSKEKLLSTTSFLGSLAAVISEMAYINLINREQTAHLEDRIKERTDLLENANRELESFSYSVSHDLRAPIRHILGFTDILEKKIDSGDFENSKEILNKISDSAAKMEKLIDDLINFSRTGQQELKKEKLDMNYIVKNAMTEFKNLIQGRVIEWKIADLPVVKGDRSLLQSVWINLIDNAIKYTSKKHKAEISIGFSQRNNELEFYIKDNGVGFDMEFYHKLFGVFQRLHHEKDFPGTGIGLANVKQIINRHGGRIRAEGKTDSGATFYFSLPTN